MIDPTYDPRAALEITRYHTWRTLRDQSVGEHSCQIMRIMLCVWPTVPRKLLEYAVFHDIDEAAGDIPYPFKSRYPALRTAYNEAATAVRTRMMNDYAVPRQPNLTVIEEQFFKLCEYIEMWEYGISEVNMGNMYAVVIAENCMKMVPRLCEAMPEDVAKSVMEYIQRRMKQESTIG